MTWFAFHELLQNVFYIIIARFQFHIVIVWLFSAKLPISFNKEMFTLINRAIAQIKEYFFGNSS